MRTYAEAMRCPDCDAVRVPGPRCGHCGLLLQGPLADKLWGLLTATDATLAQMRAERAVQTPVAEFDLAAPAGPTSLPRFQPSSGRSVAEGARRRHVSVAAVLLALGALLVVVAAFVFVAVTWGQLSLATRALLLAAVTTAAATVATLITRRSLRASAEAAWAVTLALLALDVAAARSAGLLGLDRPSETAYLIAAGVLYAAVSTGVAVATRRSLHLSLVMPQLASLAGLVVAASVALDAWDARTAWRLLVAAAAAAAVTGIYRLLQLPLVTAVAAGATVLLAASQVLVAELDVIAAPTWRAAWLNGRAWPSVASVLLLLAGGYAVSRWSEDHREEADRDAVPPGEPNPALPGVLVSVAAFTAAGIGLSWLLTPSLAAANGRGDAVVLAAAAGGLAAVSIPLADAWSAGLRALTAVIGVVSLAGCRDDVAAAGLALVTSALPVWQQPLDVSLDRIDVAGPPVWTAVLQLLVAAASLLVAARVWRLPGGRTSGWLRQVGAAAAGVLGVVACLLPVVAVRPPAAGLCATLVALGAAVAASGLLDRIRLGQGPLGVLLLGLASYEALTSPVLSALTWAAVSVVLLAAGARLTSPGTPQLEAVGTVAVTLAGGLAVASMVATGEALDFGRRTTVLLVVAVALGLTAAATLLRQRRGLRHGLEVAALLAALLAVAGGVTVTAEDGPAFLALVLTLLGAGVALLAVLLPDRRRLAPVGGALLAVAWWLRLMASNVETVEAYTLPVATPLLLAGLWAMLRRPGTRSLAALLPGLLLATAPSLPAALAAPATTRGLLLGLAALVLVGGGARLGWAAPFAVGVVVAVLLAFAHLTPLADALPRWVILAVAGVLLLAVGTTWESRARQARRGLAAVRAMR